MNLTVAFQAPNRIGLGHLNRLSCIASALQHRFSSIRVPFVVEGGDHLFLEGLGLPYLSIPSTHCMYRSELWRAWSTEDRYSIERMIARTVISTLEPTAIVFDTLPNLAIARVAIENGIPIVVCLRRVRDL